MNETFIIDNLDCPEQLDSDTRKRSAVVSTDTSPTAQGSSIVTMGNGWIKIHREVEGHWVFKDANAMQLWVWLLLKANYKPLKARLDGQVVTIGVGEVLTSLEQMAMVCCSSVQRVRTLIKHFESDGMITRKSTRKATHLSICNYASYQELQHGNQQQSNSRATAEQQDVKNVRSKEDKKEEKRGRFTPPSLDEVKSYFASVGQPEPNAERMWSFYDSKDWMVGKNKMKNWHSACHQFYSKTPKRNEVTAYVDQKWPADEWGNQPQAKHAEVWYLRQTASGWKFVDNWKASLTLYIEQNEGKL